MATDEVAPLHQHVPRGVLVLALLITAGRLALGALLIVVMLSFVPSSSDGSMVVPVIVALVGAALYAYFFRRQLRRISHSRFPMLEASEALVLLASLFLGVFAMIYVAISLNDPGAFTEPLDAFTSYYFALTVLATVGFGDITPVTTLARSFTMVQMALDLVFIAVLIRIVSSAARKVIVNRGSAGEGGASAAS